VAGRDHEHGASHDSSNSAPGQAHRTGRMVAFSWPLLRPASRHWLREVGTASARLQRLASSVRPPRPSFAKAGCHVPPGGAVAFLNK